jgi:ABC-type uncharacterized transport system ATPase subunit
MAVRTASAGDVALALVGLRRRFGEVVAVDGLSFSVPSGRLFGFVGRNGAGKTTTMRIICGLLAADDGTVTWRGEAIDARVRDRIGYMPEERGLYPKMRTRDQLEYFGVLRGLSHAQARAAATEWLGRLGLGDRAGSQVEHLSRGNQQRVQLAAALVHRPELLVLDEPFAGLDPIVCDLLTEVLREQAARGVPVLFSSHQLELVEHICESVAIIDRGHRTARDDGGPAGAPLLRGPQGRAVADRASSHAMAGRRASPAGPLQPPSRHRRVALTARPRSPGRRGVLVLAADPAPGGFRRASTNIADTRPLFANVCASRGGVAASRR